MSIDLKKKTAEDSILSLLQKKADEGVELGELIAAVQQACDYSASAAEFYRAKKKLSGNKPSDMDDATSRVLAYVLTGLDDDGTVPTYFFHHGVFPKMDLTEDNYKGFVSDFAKKNQMGGTNFTPVMQAMIDNAQENSDDPTKPPVLNVIYTDGVPADRDETEQLLRSRRTKNEFWLIVLMGRDRAGEVYVRHLDNNLSGPGLDNVGVVVYPDPGSVTDEEFYKLLTEEFFGKWFPAARAAGYTYPKR